MANQDAPRGFRPVRYLDGRGYEGACVEFYKDTSAGIIGIGDPVIAVTNSSDPEGRPEAVRATTGAAISGICVGIGPIATAPDQFHLAAADTGVIRVATSPDLLFEVQDNGGATGIVVTNLRQHIDSVAAINANTVTGKSNYELDTEAIATDNTYRLEQLVRRPDNVVGANADWLVSINLHTDVNASATSKTEV